MSIVNRVKGFVRTVTGVLPLTLTNCVDEDSIIDYTLYGQSVQNGTPTPETPVEVESVGEKTKNLFNYADYTTLTSYNGNDISANWLTIDGDLFYIKYDYYNGCCWLTPTKQWGLLAGTYTLSGKCKDNTIKGNPKICYCGIRWSDDTRNAGWGKTNSNDGEWYNFSYTFTITEDKTVKGIYLQDNGATAKSSICFTNIQLEEGPTATDYEPYGYKIPIKVSGKNLIKLSDAQFSVGGVSVISDSITQKITMKGTASSGGGRLNSLGEVNLEEGTYVFTSQSDATSNVAITKKDETSVIFWCNRSIITITKPGTYIIGVNVVSGTEYDHTFGVMLVKGEENVEYEPYFEPVTTEIYLDEPLCSVRYSSNSYIDYIDYKTGLLHKKTKVIVLTGKENWTIRTGCTNTFQFSIGVTIFAGFCTHYPSFASNYIDKQNGIYLLNTGALIITDMRHANLDDFKAYLKEQYEAGTPVTCVVGDKNGTIDPINVDLPKIPIFNGTSIYTAETSIQPSGMTVEYYGKEI